MKNAKRQELMNLCSQQMDDIEAMVGPLNALIDSAVAGKRCEELREVLNRIMALNARNRSIMTKIADL